MATSSLQGSPCQRSRTHGDILCETLEDLGEYDLKKFKSKLSDYSYGGRGPIPHGRLEKADCINTKDHIIKVYGKEAALEVTIDVLQQISLMGTAEDLRQKVTQTVTAQKTSSDAALADCRLRYVNKMRERHRRMEDRNARLGESVSLEKRFISLLLIQTYRDEEQRQHEIIASGRRHLQIMANRSSDVYSPTTIQALFDPDEDGSIPKTVVLQGPAGIGKTMTSQKIMLDWASGNLYKDKFQFVFYISCREVNTITGNISLARYLSIFCGLTCPPEFFSSIFDNPEGILFIIDGFDELKLPSMNDTEVCDDPFQEVSKEILLYSLLRRAELRRTLLSESSLIITTRPLSLMKLKGLVQFPRCVEILGFTGNQREEYFYHFFETKEQADLALGTVRDNVILFTMCVVPIICWIVCTVMRQLLKEGLSVIDCKTSTSIYLLYLKGLVKYHGRDSAQSISTCIQKLCALANEGVWDQRILFEESDLDRHGLSVSEVESVFLNENIFHSDIGIRTCYSFIHLSVQEFFAALYYVLGGKAISRNATLQKKQVKNLLKASERKPQLSLIVQFLFGLSSEKQIQETQRTIGCPISFREQNILEEWLKTVPTGVHNKILSCLYETQDEDYVKRMMSHFLNVDFNCYISGDQKNTDLRAVAYCLEKSTRRHKVSFILYRIGPKDQEILSKALSKCLRLSFCYCGFPDNDEDVLRAGYSISRMLKHCQVEELVIEFCDLTPSCCADLCPVITTNRSLTRLDLTGNDLQDSGIKLLCGGLRHPTCGLQELRLKYCHLTSSSCYDLCSVLTTNRSLTRLDLAGNKLEKSGIKRLCEGLRHPACILQDLRLQSCGLTSSCCADLRSVLTTNRSLTRLDLSLNDLENSGITLLSEGLRHLACTLQDVMLQWCRLTSSCCADLRSVISTNRSLTRLDLAGNPLQDSGIKLLCEGLRHPACALQELRLQECALTSSCCADLRSVLITNRSLTRLDLSGNALKDSGIKLLCEGLRRPACALQDLSLYRCGLTSSCCDDLRSVITTNRFLTRLDLRGNKLQHCAVNLRQCVRPPLQLELEDY